MRPADGFYLSVSGALSIRSRNWSSFGVMLRGCFIISVKAQVGVFLFKLFIMKREHSGVYVTDE